MEAGKREDNEVIGYSINNKNEESKNKQIMMKTIYFINFVLSQMLLYFISNSTVNEVFKKRVSPRHASWTIL